MFKMLTVKLVTEKVTHTGYNMGDKKEPEMDRRKCDSDRRREKE